MDNTKPEDDGEVGERDRSLQRRDEGSGGGRGEQRHSEPPLAPGISQGQPVHVALGMQLLQKNAFEDLDSEVQGQLIELAKGMDQNAFEHACETLRVQSEFQRNHLDSSERSNKQRLFAAVVMAVLLLACGTGITIMLLNAGENQLAFNLMMSGLACVGMLLGGVGIGRLFNSGGQ